MNHWESHFRLWKELRSASRWAAQPKLLHLCRMYNACLSSKLSEPGDIMHELRGIRGGKHSQYQSVWSWNALAFQLYKFHRDFPGARLCLEEGLRAASALSAHRYGKEQGCVEAVWLVLLVNFIRLEFREENREGGALSMNELRNYLAGSAWKPAIFGAVFAELFETGKFRFSFHPELVAFLSLKLQEEENRWLT